MPRNEEFDPKKRPLGVTLLVAFFGFGVTMCMLTAFLLTFPGTLLDITWRLKPTARADLIQMGYLVPSVMIVIGVACAAAAIGLARGWEWGRRVAVCVLVINMAGDTANAFIRNDFRTLIGLPVAIVMIAYLLSGPVRNWVARKARSR